VLNALETPAFDPKSQKPAQSWSKSNPYEVDGLVLKAY